MQERDPSLVGRQCVVEEALDEPHAIANYSLGNPAVAQDAQHGLRGIRPEILAGDRGGSVLCHGIREALERIKAIVGSLDPQILAQQQEKKRAVADRDATLHDIALDAPDLFELTQKVETPVEASPINAWEKRGIVVVGGDRFFKRVTALDLQAYHREPVFDQLLEHDVLFREFDYGI